MGGFKIERERKKGIIAVYLFSRSIGNKFTFSELGICTHLISLFTLALFKLSETMIYTKRLNFECFEINENKNKFRMRSLWNESNTKYVVGNGNVWCSCRKGTEVVVKLWINLVTNKLQTTIITIIILRGFIYLCVIYLEQNYQFIIFCKFIFDKLNRTNNIFQVYF